MGQTKGKTSFLMLKNYKQMIT